ncbi:TPA: hypothetical protein ACHVCR_001375 [Streptococcus suis]
MVELQNLTSPLTSSNQPHKEEKRREEEENRCISRRLWLYPSNRNNIEIFDFS